jgi:hypothetical protein
MVKVKQDMKKALAVLNELERMGMIYRYAIGGAIAALFYMNPFETEDLDILVLLPLESSQRLDPLSPIYEELRSLGFREDGPYMIIHGIPVQFRVAYNTLIEEAIEEANEVSYEDVPTRVPSAEHLAAIMLNTGRPKDRARFDELRSQKALDDSKLKDILQRYKINERFHEWTMTN